MFPGLMQLLFWTAPLRPPVAWVRVGKVTHEDCPGSTDPEKAKSGLLRWEPTPDH